MDETSNQLKWKTPVCQKPASIETSNINSFYFITSLGYFFHLHFALGANKKNSYGRVDPAQRVGNRYRWEDMSPRASSCYDDAVQFHAVTVSVGLTMAASPSRDSTFLATLKIIPIETQVNKNELPPIEINGKVTPVTGSKLTLTAIFVSA